MSPVHQHTLSLILVISMKHIQIGLFYSFVPDAQTNEVAKMLYQHGLPELIPSSPSEQVAYLLVERASLLEMNQDPCELTCDGDTGNQRKTLPEPVNTSRCPVSKKNRNKTIISVPR